MTDDGKNGDPKGDENGDANGDVVNGDCANTGGYDDADADDDEEDECCPAPPPPPTEEADAGVPPALLGC